MVFDTLEDSYPETDHFGMLHIRRGDAIGQCDTSLSKISSYLTCSLNEVEAYGRISILFRSDETDTCYRNAIQVLVESLGFHFIDLDSIVQSTVLEYALGTPGGPRLINNMFTYKVEVEMMWNEQISFQLSQKAQRL